MEKSLNVPKSRLPRLVVIGGGFGGVRLAKCIDSNKYQVVLLDRYNYHTFQPLLYQVATAGLEPDSIARPLRSIFKEKQNFYFRLAKVESIHANENYLTTDIGILSYDYLVIASGSKTNYYGDELLEKNVFPLKQLPHALDLRSYLLQSFEQANLVETIKEQEAILNIVVVGGGPTGVEVAGALGELKKHILPADYPELDFRKMQIHLVEGGKRVLPALHENLSKTAEKYLSKFDVTLWTSNFVKSYDGNNIVLSSGSTLNTKIVIWAAGVKGNLPNGLEAFSDARSGRIKVDEYLNVIGTHNIFSIGDVAQLAQPDYPNGHPMVAPVAIQQGELLANYFNSDFKSKQKFVYRDKGSMATIGRNKAVVQISKFRFGGIFAWVVWMFVHLMSIVGFRNRVVILANWFWNYLTYDRGTRLIVRPFKRN